LFEYVRFLHKRKENGFYRHDAQFGIKVCAPFVCVYYPSADMVCFMFDVKIGL